MDQLRFALVGIGKMGLRRLAAFVSGAIPDAELTVIADVPEAVDRLKAQAAQYGVDYATSLSAVLGRHDVDAVLVSTSTAAHFHVCAAALAAGKHVFVEKPLTDNLADADRLVALAVEQRRCLGIGYNRRYWPVARAARLLREAVVGEVLDLTGETGHSHFVAPPEGARPDTFLVGPEAGPLLDLGVHVIDLALCLADGSFDRAIGSAAHGDPLPPSVSVFEKAEYSRSTGPATFSLKASYARPRKFMGVSLEVSGTRGHFRLDSGSDLLAPDYHALTCGTLPGGRFGPAQAKDLLRSHGIRWKAWEELEGGERGSFFRAVFGYDDKESWAGDLRDFAQAVREGRPQRGRDGREALALIDAARRSARSGGVRVTCGAVEPDYVVG